MMKAKCIGRMASLLLLLGMGVAVAACSSSDDNEEIIQPVVDNDLPTELNGVKVDFRLLNEAGQAMKSFKAGEDITFALTITSEREEKVDLPDIDEVYDLQMFQVFKANGEKVGLPWDGMFWRGTGLDLILKNGESRAYTCSWLNTPDAEKYDFHNAPYPWGFLTATRRSPLPKGQYYSAFDITFGDGTKVACRKDFVIM